MVQKAYRRKFSNMWHKTPFTHAKGRKQDGFPKGFFKYMANHEIDHTISKGHDSAHDKATYRNVYFQLVSKPQKKFTYKNVLFSLL